MQQCDRAGDRPHRTAQRWLRNRDVGHRIIGTTLRKGSPKERAKERTRAEKNWVGLRKVTPKAKERAKV